VEINHKYGDDIFISLNIKSSGKENLKCSQSINMSEDFKYYCWLTWKIWEACRSW